jgi:hypothetical protein
MISKRLCRTAGHDKSISMFIVLFLGGVSFGVVGSYRLRSALQILTGPRMTCFLRPAQRDLIITFFIAAIAVPASAQGRPFIFSIVTESESKPAVRFDYDVGVGERAFQSDISNQPELRIVGRHHLEIWARS